MKSNAEMRQWLTTNRESYEFYLLHGVFHDPLLRSAIMAAPLSPDDFRRESYAVVVSALIKAISIASRIGRAVEFPPKPEFLRTYVESAARELASPSEDVEEALQLIRELQNESFKSEHYCVSPFFEDWYSAGRSKRAARRLQLEDIPDVKGTLDEMQRAISSAARASRAQEDDDMYQMIHGDDMELVHRRTTGVSGLDESLNGGWGPREAYLLFGGTGSGKSIAAGQCAWHEASVNKGYPLIVSTELRAKDYIVRVVSNACGIKIPIVQDCLNFKQIRQAVSRDPSATFKLDKVEEVLDIVSKRIHVAKVDSDDGLDAKGMLERETLKFSDKFGVMPTWVCLDWLGTMADIGSAAKSSSDRALAWEYAANGCVKFADESTIPTLVLAQAVNDSQLKKILQLGDIGISKGIGKNMTLVVGVTNTIDIPGIKAAATGKSDMPKQMFLDEQFFCICKARKGEGRNIPVMRKFLFQRFESRLPGNLG